VPGPAGLCVYRILTQTSVLSWFIARLYRTLYTHALRTSRRQEVCHKFIGAPLKHTWLLYCVYAYMYTFLHAAGVLVVVIRGRISIW
jgi:hypothetical protein